MAFSMEIFVAVLFTVIPFHVPPTGVTFVDASFTLVVLLPLIERVPLTVSLRPEANCNSVPGCNTNLAPTGTTRSEPVTV